jgi:cardiolipin synthase A/B
MRLALALVAAAFICACATLPEIHPWVRDTGENRTATIVTPRGAVSPERARTVLARLSAQASSDLFERHLAIEEAVSGAPLTLGNAASLLYDGPAFYNSLFGTIGAARDHVNLEFYIIEDDEVGRRFSELLLKKAAEGVSVNLIYDSVGSISTPREFFERLRAGGVRVLEYNPANPLRARAGWRVNNRNHRKVAIVDGRIGYAGGINISDVYAQGSSPGRGGSFESGSGSRFGSAGSRSAEAPGWRDTNVRIEGPAIAQLQKLFLDTWSKQQGEPLPDRQWFPKMQPAGKHPVRTLASGPDDAAPAIYVSLLSAITYAEKTVHITMAYFVPDEQTMEALALASARGVEVILVLPSYTDFWAVFHAGRSRYSELLDAGVKIYERQKTLLHAKTIVIDGVWSTVGSSNMDWRSFLHNEELNVVVLGSDFGQQMEAMFARDLAESIAIDRETWAGRPLSIRMKEWAARVWEYWL